jgi:predicted nucleic acid-binding protein
MSKIINASDVSISSSKVLFDSNIWILIEGFCGASQDRRTAAYSGAYKKLLQNENTIVVNDYVLGEFCNRCTRFEYEVMKESDAKLPYYKVYRKSSEFRWVMESVRDTCLHILEGCEYISVGRADCDMKKALEEFCSGEIDFSDIVLAEHCAKENLHLMTDDEDFHRCNVSIITANKRLIARAHTD